MGNLGILVRIGLVGAILALGCVAVPPPVGDPSVSHPAPAATGPHQTIGALEAAATIETGEWISPWHVAAFPFDQFLPSWNVDSPGAFRVDVQVQAGEVESPWLDVGGWGTWPEGERSPTEFPGGRVAIDIVKLKETATRARVRLRAKDTARLDRLTFCFTDSSRLGEHPFTGKQRTVPPLPVEGRRQTVEAPELAPRICSPTSVSMVLDYRGISLPTARVAQELFDQENDIYGNWNRAVQGAARLGVEGYLTRINDWNEVARLLNAGHPLIISIGVKAGQLTGAPYPSTSGHLLVLIGLDGEGFARVLDPAAAPGEPIARSYALEELDVVWLRRGGTTYVLGD